MEYEAIAYMHCGLEDTWQNNINDFLKFIQKQLGSFLIKLAKEFSKNNYLIRSRFNENGLVEIDIYGNMDAFDKLREQVIRKYNEEFDKVVDAVYQEVSKYGFSYYDVVNDSYDRWRMEILALKQYSEKEKVMYRIEVEIEEDCAGYCCSTHLFAIHGDVYKYIYYNAPDDVIKRTWINVAQGVDAEDEPMKYKIICDNGYCQVKRIEEEVEETE